MNQMEYNPNQSLQTKDERQLGLFLHLAGAANTFAFPFAGIATILIWQLKKDEMPALDAHGKMATNWFLSLTIYTVVAFASLFLLVGFLLLPILWFMALVFPIIAGIKANNGEYWEYPLTIKFLK